MRFKELCTNLPAGGGLYSVWNHEKLLYIGMTQSYKQRFKTHSKWEAFEQYGANALLLLPINDWRARRASERYLIDRHNPLLCKKLGAPSRPS